MCCERIHETTVLWPSDGRLKEEGREVAPKQHGEEWWKWKEMALAGTHGIQLAVQLWTCPNRRVMSKPCVPTGTEVKVKVQGNEADVFPHLPLSS